MIGGPSACATSAAAAASKQAADTSAKGGVDYSRWDTVGNDLSDSEESQEVLDGSL